MLFRFFVAAPDTLHVRRRNHKHQCRNEAQPSTTVGVDLRVENYVQTRDARAEMCPPMYHVARPRRQFLLI